MIFSLAIPAGVIFADENETVVEESTITVDTGTNNDLPDLNSVPLSHEPTCTNKSVTGSVDGANAIFTVPEGACPIKVSFSSYSHAGTIRPFEDQVLVENITNTYGPGTYNLGSVKLSCNWQTDLYYGDVQEHLNPSYGHSDLIAYDYVENQNCTTPAPVCTFDIVSDSKTIIEGGYPAVATYDENPEWTAYIPGATWIWKTFFVELPLEDEANTFTRSFVINNNIQDASLVVGADNKYSLSVNGILISDDNETNNFYDIYKDVYDIKSYLNVGVNILTFTVTNIALEGSNPETNPAGLLYKLSVTQSGTDCNYEITNTPPIITLVDANPFNMTVNTVFTDPGATADDLEDGNLTNKIVVTGNVATTTVGSYTLTYTVTDSGGLSTSTTRVVVVSPVSTPLIPTVSLTADPQTITAGASSTLAWSSQNTTSCLAPWTTASSTSGTMSVAPSVTTEYAITCTGPEGSATATTTVTVNPVVVPPVNPPSGGGGGGSLSGGHRHDVVVGEILGATSCMYLRDYLKIDWENDPIEVLKLQSFLNVFEKENLSYTGIYDQNTFNAVVRFQNKYSGDILKPWGDNVTTGFVYILTKKKVNEIYCNTIYPISQTEQNEINNFRTSGNNTSNVSGNTGMDTTISGRDIGALLGVSTDSLEDSISNVLNGSPVVELKDSNKSVLRNAAISLFSLPEKMFGRLFQSCGYTPTLLFLILIALVVIIIKLFTNSIKGDAPKNLTPEVPVVGSSVKDSPVIVLPGVMSDEEIIIENPEEGPEDVLVGTPDLRSDDKA